jgi:processive 1,2-diacylglycerol beta-glucosyltransferase
VRNRPRPDFLSSSAAGITVPSPRVPRNPGATKRLLILTSATGAGHDTHAQATAAWCQKIYGPTVEVLIDHVLENSHYLYRGGVEFYNVIQRHGPWFHHFYYNVGEFLELINYKTVGFGKDYCVQLLEEFRPDAVLSVHGCLNLGYFELVKQVLGPRVPCATYCAEFGGGYGFSRNWVNRGGHGFFARTEEAAQVALRRRVEPRHVHVAGHWAPPPFYGPGLSAAAKEAAFEKMGLNPRLFTLLLSTGGAGALNHLSFLKALLPLRDRLQAIVLCGRNENAQRKIENWADNQASFAVRALPFTNEMPNLLRMASAVVARAGATTAGEALLSGCPIIFNALGGMMPQEIPTWRYFKARNIGDVVSRPSAITAILRRWLDDPAGYAALRDRLRPFRHDVTPEAALHSLLDK